EGLDAEAQRGNVEKQDVGLFTAQNTCLDRSSESDYLVRIDRLVRILAKILLDHLLHFRDAGRTADEDDLFDVLGRQSGVLDGLFDRRHQALENGLDELLELGPRELGHKVLRPAR